MKEWTIVHSAKGTSWKKHKYVKKVGNRYYYAHDIEAGRLKMKAADEFNNQTKKAGSDPDKREIAKLHYNNSLSNIRRNNSYQTRHLPVGVMMYGENGSWLHNDIEDIKEAATKGLKKANQILNEMAYGGKENYIKGRRNARKWDQLINGR